MNKDKENSIEKLKNKPIKEWFNLHKDNIMSRSIHNSKSSVVFEQVTKAEIILHRQDKTMDNTYALEVKLFKYEDGVYKLKCKMIAHYLDGDENGPIGHIIEEQ